MLCPAVLRGSAFLTLSLLTLVGCAKLATADLAF